MKRTPAFVTIAFLAGLGNKTVEPRVLSFIDNTHPATTELFDDAVVRDGLANLG
jgi:hypothetical protein